MTKAIITTSANPFHYGHKSLYDEAEKIFGKGNVKVILASNPDKHVDFDQIKRHLIPYNVNFKECPYTCIADYCNENKIPFIVRGIRNAVDAEYELKLSFINKEINPNVQTIFIPTDETYSKISSSTIRELIKYDKMDMVFKYMNPDAFWRYKKKPIYRCYFGKSCSGKSKATSHVSKIDFDTYFWEILTKVKGKENCAYIKEESKKLFAEKKFKEIHEQAKELMNETFWKEFFTEKNFPWQCNEYPITFDWASIGFYFDLLSPKRRADFELIKFETTASKRKKYIALKGFEDKIKFLDEMYVDPPYYDDKYII